MYKLVGKLLLGGVLLIKAISACALYDGFYTGLEAGYSDSGYTKNNVKVDIPGLFLTNIPIGETVPDLPATVPVRTDEDNVGLRLYMGYKFQKMFGLEFGYTRYADVVFDNIFGINSSDLTTFQEVITVQLLGANTRVETQSVDFLGKLFIPILDLFEVFVEYGYAYVDINTPDKVDVIMTETTQPSPSLSIRLKSQRKHEQKLLAKYGFGAGYSFDDRFSLDLMYSQVNGEGKFKSSSLTAINLIVSFG